MDAATLLDNLERTREQLLMIIADLPDEALLQPGVIADWSVKDVLAHIAAWESELITGLMRLQQGKKPAHLLEALADHDAYNAARYLENKERGLDAVFDDFQNVRTQLEGWLEEFDDRALTDPKHFKALQGMPLWQLIKNNSYGHEAQHIPYLAAFAHRWAEENEKNDDPA
jgi:uncharacterized damage-inducible protein DinB